jgi:hypothetical protein
VVEREPSSKEGQRWPDVHAWVKESNERRVVKRVTMIVEKKRVTDWIEKGGDVAVDGFLS